jgi:hypothetical protein
LRLVRNRFGLPTAAMNDAAPIRFTPGTVINRRISGQLSALLSDQPLDRSNLGIQELDVPEPRVDRLAFLQRSEPPTALDAEQIRVRRLGLEPALQRSVDLVLAPGS